MSDGKKYLKLYDQGLTYAEIAEAYEVSRNTVAGQIYDYRKENNIPVSDKGRKVSQAKKQNKKARTYLSVHEKDQRKIRQEELDQCVRREDGVLQCPTKYAAGYGIQPRCLGGDVLRG